MASKPTTSLMSNDLVLLKIELLKYKVDCNYLNGKYATKTGHVIQTYILSY